MVKGFKALNSDMIYRGYQFEVGQTYEIAGDEPLEVSGNNGFHFYEKLDNVFNYYHFGGCRVVEVESLDDVVARGNRFATKKWRVVRELTQDDFKNYKFTDLIPDLWFKDRSDEELLVYKDHPDYKVRLLLVQKLKDIGLMFDTFKSDVNSLVRIAVVKRIKDFDQNLMFNEFKNDPDWIVRKKLVECMKDLDLMFTTFKDDLDSNVRLTVEKRITNNN